MKKRRELDALVTGGKTSKNGRHELLRNESDSSEEIEEFTIPQKSVVRKRVRSQCCSTCATMCGTFLLLTCIVSIGGLVWMVIQLKNDMADLRGRIVSAETTTKNTNDKLGDWVLSATKEHTKVDALLSNDGVIPKLHTNVTELQKGLAVVNATLLKLIDTVGKLQTGLSGTSKDEVQNQLESLSKSVADLGSDVHSIQLQQTAFEQQLGALKATIDEKQHTTTPSSTARQEEMKLKSVQQELEHLSRDITTVNETLGLKCDHLSRLVFVQSDGLQEIRNHTMRFEKQLDLLRQQTSAGSKFNSSAISETVKFQVERFLSTASKQANSSHYEESVKLLVSRLDHLEAVEKNHTIAIVNLTSVQDHVNQTIRQIMSRNSHRDKMLNETVQTIHERLEKVETAIQNVKTPVESLPKHTNVTSGGQTNQENHRLSVTTQTINHVPTSSTLKKAP